MHARILVVDDESDVKRLLEMRFRKQIRSKKYEFAFILNGSLALQELANEPRKYDMVLSDIKMPKMDGLTFISHIKKHYPMVKVIMVSAYGNIDNIRQAMNFGAFDFITKPINFVDLEKTIDKTIEELALLKEAREAQALKRKNEQLKALDELKSRYFINISHEFRSPITVIQGMANKIAELPEKWLENGLPMIQRNSDHLLKLINQILALAKLEAGKIPLSYIRDDIVQYFYVVFESFQSYGESKGIGFHILSDIESLIMDYDPDHLMEILSNLTSNAIKFTPEGGHIYISIRQENTHLIIQIRDTGIGISEDELPHIFNRFYQADNSKANRVEGTGIGLAITKELVKLMNGTIQVSSILNKGTTFTVSLPISRKAVVKEFKSLEERAVQPIYTHHENQAFLEAERRYLPYILIVEDHTDVKNYMISCLEADYYIETAENGAEGIEKSLATIPDLIICDVMMPLKNGFEVCHTLKRDIRTSHIPIILLTGKADIQSKIEGLSTGADAYLTKPFNEKELKVRLLKLLELRKELQKKYQNINYLKVEERTRTNQVLSMEETFLQNFYQIIQQHLNDYELNVPKLCKLLGISRTQLHRKLKALTGKSAIILIKEQRLEKARELLYNVNLSISSIAYDVGFNNPNWFTRAFSNFYGVTPSQYRARIST